mgnify:CR=1 FL=1|tara:strand:- start:2063 stop:2584 length:522 start_codon:yes stop_codon:yes gene_type:complete
MAIKKIITVPNEILRKISEPIEKIGVNEKNLIKCLFDTMYDAKGIGLAAIQIGIPKRIVVLDVSKDEHKKQPYCLINPIIKKQSKDTSIYEEGCLSIPETFIEIERPRTILLEYIDQYGKKKELNCDGLLSTCVQHEIQHCDGKLIIDFLSKLKKDLIIKRISKQQKSKKIIA